MSQLFEPRVIEINGVEHIVDPISDIHSQLLAWGKKEYEKALIKKIRGNFSGKENSFLPKLLKIGSLTVVRKEEYYGLLIEAIESYLLWNNKATIACCWIIAELITNNLCYELDSSMNYKWVNQHARLIILRLSKKVSQLNYQKMDQIRKIRNKYIHENWGSSWPIDPEKDAEDSLNKIIDVIKVVYKPNP